ncbi:MAG: winged helix-turn-helix transcriptional regulator [bacterium]|nr:winged helix-turn-helix transcriptional regulator [bacterium]
MQEITDQLLEKIAERFRAMSNPVRLKILHELEEGELSVSAILERIGGSQANASKHLAVLRGVGLVAPRREGPSVYYRISDPAVFTICEAVCDSLLKRASDEVETIEQGREILAVRG